MNHKHEVSWLLKICTLYTLCTLILSKSLHLTIGSSLTLIQNELWVPKSCHAHSKAIFLCLGFSKNAIKILTYYTPIILVIHHFFKWKMVKIGSSVMCFHPRETINWTKRFSFHHWNQLAEATPLKNNIKHKNLQNKNTKPNAEKKTRNWTFGVLNS